MSVSQQKRAPVAMPIKDSARAGMVMVDWGISQCRWQELLCSKPLVLASFTDRVNTWPLQCSRPCQYKFPSSTAPYIQQWGIWSRCLLVTSTNIQYLIRKITVFSNRNIYFLILAQCTSELLYEFGCCHIAPSSLHQWRHEQGVWNVWQKHQKRHKPTLFCFPLAKNETTCLRPEKFKFEAK